MYAQSATHKYQAYAAASMTVSKLRQVVMLYDGAIRFTQQANEAIKAKDFELRYNLLTKATDIITGLQSSLDHENGGEIAKLLYNYYASIDARIFSVHRSNDGVMLEGVIKELRLMRDTWNSIDQTEQQKSASAQSAAMPATAMVTTSAPQMPTGLGVSA